MKNPLLFLSNLILMVSGLFAQQTGNYTLVVEGFDWGPAVNKIILDLGEPAQAVPEGSFTVYATRSTDLAEIPPALAAGERTVLGTYLSDAKGIRVDSGSYLTLVLAVGPQMPLASPFQYARNERINGNF